MLDKMLQGASTKRVVHKFSVHEGVIELGMPAKFLHVAMKDGTPWIWVQHCPESSVKANAEIRIFGTGDVIEDGFEFLGTYLSDIYVWHVYAKAEKK